MSAIADKPNHSSFSTLQYPSRLVPDLEADSPRTSQTKAIPSLRSQIVHYVGLFAVISLASAVGLYIAESILVAAVH